MITVPGGRELIFIKDGICFFGFGGGDGEASCALSASLSQFFSWSVSCFFSVTGRLGTSESLEQSSRGVSPETIQYSELESFYVEF